jgi:hypothetical protein
MPFSGCGANAAVLDGGHQGLELVQFHDAIVYSNDYQKLS